MKTCKQFFPKRLMLFTSQDVLKVSRRDASMYGFCFLSYPIGYIECQQIYAFDTDIYRAANWCDMNAESTTRMFAVVPAFNL